MWHGSEYGIGIGWGLILVPVVIVFVIWLIYRIKKNNGKSKL
jgi:hypothetical protein